MAGLVMAMFADSEAPLAPCVFATDAQGHDDGVDWGGYGIVGSPITRDYAQMLFARGTKTGRNVAKLDSSLGTKHANNLSLTVPFSAVARVIVSSTETLYGAWCGPVAV